MSTVPSTESFLHDLARRVQLTHPSQDDSAQMACDFSRKYDS